MAPGFLEVARDFYHSARPEARSDALEKWLGAVNALGGIVEDVGVDEVPEETRRLLETHLVECLGVLEVGPVKSTDLPATLVANAKQLAESLDIRAGAVDTKAYLVPRRKSALVETVSRTAARGLVHAVTGPVLALMDVLSGILHRLMRWSRRGL